jgi:cytochrome bd-type quinol oxidase subunit 2
MSNSYWTNYLLVAAFVAVFLLLPYAFLGLFAFGATALAAFFLQRIRHARRTNSRSRDENRNRGS